MVSSVESRGFNGRERDIGTSTGGVGTRFGRLMRTRDVEACAIARTTLQTFTSLPRGVGKKPLACEIEAPWPSRYGGTFR